MKDKKTSAGNWKVLTEEKISHGRKKEEKREEEDFISYSMGKRKEERAK